MLGGRGVRARLLECVVRPFVVCVGTVFCEMKLYFSRAPQDAWAELGDAPRR